MNPRHRFIVRYGVLAYGGGLFVVFNLLHILRLRAHGVSLQGLPLWLASTAVVCPLVGYGFGALLWRRMVQRQSG